MKNKEKPKYSIWQNVCFMVQTAWRTHKRVDGVIRPGYAMKSAIKIAMFMLVPLIASRMDRSVLYLSLLRPKKKGLLANAHVCELRNQHHRFYAAEVTNEH